MEVKPWKELTTAEKRLGIGGLIVVILVVGLGLGVGAALIIPDSSSPANPAADQSSPEELKARRAASAFDLVVAAYVAQPPGRPAPLRIGCSQSAFPEVCPTASRRMALEWWPGAWKGDVGAQRSVAECLETGCSGAVHESDVDACAWRAVIRISGRATDDDVMATNTACSRLDDGGRIAAEANARRIILSIPAVDATPAPAVAARFQAWK